MGSTEDPADPDPPASLGILARFHALQSMHHRQGCITGVAHGGYFIVKTKGVINPMIRQAHTHEGGEIKGFQNLPPKRVKSKVSKYQALDLDVAWEGDLEARVIVTWDAENKRPCYLVTNLPRAQFTLEQVGDAYRLRWQVERRRNGRNWRGLANHTNSA